MLWCSAAYFVPKSNAQLSLMMLYINRLICGYSIFTSGVMPPPSRTSRPLAVWNTVVRLSGILATVPSGLRCE